MRTEEKYDGIEQQQKKHDNRQGGREFFPEIRTCVFKMQAHRLYPESRLSDECNYSTLFLQSLLGAGTSGKAYGDMPQCTKVKKTPEQILEQTERV
ncbi:hypothetical protein CE91St36_05790 [Christensenellaceae bacterium]|nr:hypothetical protein CE91St36_05790 [Christensenellaceae bacterium]BDF60430.1 hypothetical protein CE91St37_05800 [Christensenellaceae bacterium]